MEPEGELDEETSTKIDEFMQKGLDRQNLL